MPKDKNIPFKTFNKKHVQEEPLKISQKQNIFVDTRKWLENKQNPSLIFTLFSFRPF